MLTPRVGATRAVKLSARLPRWLGWWRPCILVCLASTADSMALSRSFIPGSESPRWAHSLSECDVAKHSSHRLVDVAMAMKHIVYREELITDHLVLPVSAACCQKAAS